MRALFAALLLAGCMEGPAGSDLPPGYPPKMGDISGTLAGRAVAWETYDFSVGAFDASAWMSERDGVKVLHLRGMEPGKPNSDLNRLVVTANLGGSAVVEVIGETGGAQLSSAGRAAQVVVDRLERDGAARYGHATGRISATLCAVGGDGAQADHCEALEVGFDTSVQFDNM